MSTIGEGGRESGVPLCIPFPHAFAKRSYSHNVHASLQMPKVRSVRARSLRWTFEMIHNAGPGRCWSVAK